VVGYGEAEVDAFSAGGHEMGKWQSIRGWGCPRYTYVGEWARYTVGVMDAERIIGEIELLERMFRQPDLRPLNEREILAANRRHDEKLARSPWFRLWKSYGICCRPEPPGLRLPDGD